MIGQIRVDRKQGGIERERERGGGIGKGPQAGIRTRERNGAVCRRTAHKAIDADKS